MKQLIWSHAGFSLHWCRISITVVVYGDFLYAWCIKMHFHDILLHFAAYLCFIFHYWILLFIPLLTILFQPLRLCYSFPLHLRIIPFASLSHELCARSLMASIHLSLQWIRAVTPSSMLIGFIQTEHDHWTVSNYADISSLRNLSWHVFNPHLQIKHMALIYGSLT